MQNQKLGFWRYRQKIRNEQPDQNNNCCQYLRTGLWNQNRWASGNRSGTASSGASENNRYVLRSGPSSSNQFYLKTKEKWLNNRCPWSKSSQRYCIRNKILKGSTKDVTTQNLENPVEDQKQRFSERAATWRRPDNAPRNGQWSNFF